MDNYYFQDLGALKNMNYMYNFEFYNPQIVMYQQQQTANRFANKRIWKIE